MGLKLSYETKNQNFCKDFIASNQTLDSDRTQNETFQRSDEDYQHSNEGEYFFKDVDRSNGKQKRFLMNNSVQQINLQNVEQNLMSFNDENSVEFHDDTQKSSQLLASSAIQKFGIKSNITSNGQLDYSPVSRSSRIYNAISQRNSSVDDSCRQSQEMIHKYDCQIDELQRKLQTVLVENQKLAQYNESLHKQSADHTKKEGVKLEGSSLHQQLAQAKNQVHEMQQKLFETENQIVCRDSSLYATIEVQQKKIEDQQKAIMSFIQQNEDLKSQVQQKHQVNEMHQRDNSILQSLIQQSQFKESNYQSNLQQKEQQSRLQEEEKRRDDQNIIQQQLNNQQQAQIQDMSTQIERLNLFTQLNKSLLTQLHQQEEQEQSQKNNLFKQINDYRKEIELSKKAHNKREQELLSLQHQSERSLEVYEKDKKSSEADIQAMNQKLKSLEDVKYENIRKIIESQDHNIQLGKKIDTYKFQIKELSKASDTNLQLLKSKYEQLNVEYLNVSDKKEYLQQMTEKLQLEIGQRKQNENDLQIRIEQIKTLDKYRKTYDVFPQPQEHKTDVTQINIQLNERIINGKMNDEQQLKYNIPKQLAPDYLSLMKDSIQQNIPMSYTINTNLGAKLFYKNENVNRSTSANGKSKIQQELRTRTAASFHDDFIERTPQHHQRSVQNANLLESQMKHLFAEDRRNEVSTKIKPVRSNDFFNGIKFKPNFSVDQEIIKKRLDPVALQTQDQNTDQSVVNNYKRYLNQMIKK